MIIISFTETVILLNNMSWVAYISPDPFYRDFTRLVILETNFRCQANTTNVSTASFLTHSTSIEVNMNFPKLILDTSFLANI